jgi:hypothetical protein
MSGNCAAFDGANQFAQVNLDLSDTQALTVSFWMKWNAFANDDKLAMELGAGANGYNDGTTGFIIDPNSSMGGGPFEVGFRGDGGHNHALFARPSAGVWHHYAFVLNKAAPAASEILPYVDGAPVTYTKPTANDNTNTFGNDTLFVMSRNGTALFGAGQMDGIRIDKRVLSAREILALAAAAPVGGDRVAPARPRGLRL